MLAQADKKLIAMCSSARETYALRKTPFSFKF